MTGRRIRRGLAVLAVVGLVGGGYAAYAASGDESAYRTAVAAVGDVEQTLALAGTVEPSGRADLQFGTSGAVATVAVAAGDDVKAGQVLVRLDRTSLTTAVRRARAQLTSAQAQLESDQDAQADAVSAASDTSSGSSSEQSTPSSGSSEQAPSTTPTPQATQQATQPTNPTKPTKALTALAKQQKAVTTAQTAASTAIKDAKAALAAQTTACEDAYDGPTTDPSDDPAADPSADPSATPTAAPSVTADPADRACSTALIAVQTAQDTVATAQGGLQEALTDLADTLTTAVKALNESETKTSDQSSDEPATQQSTEPPTSSAQADQSSSKTPSTQSPSTQSPTSQGQSDSSSQGRTQTVTAATLARDQASIDQARAELVAAKQSLRGATVRAPYAGRVASVAAVAGGSVSAGDAAATVIAPGTTTVELDATDTQVRQLKAGQEAGVRLAGAESTLTGTVTAIGAVPDTSSGSTIYPVTITLDERDLGLPSGVTAAVAVVVGTAKAVVTVPASAIRSGSVTVLDGDTTQRSRVTTGVVGTSLIEVTDGLAAGDRVVLADLTTAVPASDADTNERTGGFGGGGFSGGAGGPGGGGPRSFSR